MAKKPAAGYMPRAYSHSSLGYQQALSQSGLVISSETQEQASIEVFDTHLNQHAPDQAASHISLAEAPPAWDQCSAPASATAPSAEAIPLADSMGPAAVAVAAGHYSLWQAVLSVRDMGSRRDMQSGRDIVVASRAEALHLRRSACGRGNGSFFGRRSDDGAGAGVRVLLLLLRGVRALLCAWSVRGEGSLLLRVRGLRR